MFSAIILTKNEEQNIAKCIESIKYSDDIVVFDSFSNDNTKKIALSKGARVIEREFDNWASHQNWALKNIKFKNPWIIYIDADEELVSDQFKELENIISSKLSHENVAYEIKREDYFFNKPIKRSQKCNYIVRFFLKDFIKYERLVNPKVIVNGSIGRLNKTKIIHYPFSKGIFQWIERHNEYSSLEAKQILLGNSHSALSAFKKLLLAQNSQIRRASMKELFYKLPFRPLIEFLRLYIFKLGFLDGKVGFKYAILQSYYTYLIDIKVEENLMKKIFN